MSADLVGARTAPSDNHATIAAEPAAPLPERAQLVWQRALDLAIPPSSQDRLALALELLRAAHHDPATMAHALALGRTRLRAHPRDAGARGGVIMLEASIAFLGIKRGTGDVAVPRP